MIYFWHLFALEKHESNGTVAGLSLGVLCGSIKWVAEDGALRALSRRSCACTCGVIKLQDELAMTGME